MKQGIVFLCAALTSGCASMDEFWAGTGMVLEGLATTGLAVANAYLDAQQPDGGSGGSGTYCETVPCSPKQPTYGNSGGSTNNGGNSSSTRYPASGGAAPSHGGDTIRPDSGPMAYEHVYARYSIASRLRCSPDISQGFRSRFSKFSDTNLKAAFNNAAKPGFLRERGQAMAPTVRQYSLRQQRNEIGSNYYQALETARQACQITSACSSGEALYESFPGALSPRITTQGRVGVETGALAALQVAYVARQMVAESNDEIMYYINNCMR